VPQQGNRTRPNPYTQEDIENLQIMRSSPILHLRTVLLQFIQGLFWYMPRGQYHWEPNIAETEIVITDESPLKVKEYGFRPGITITRAPLVLSSLGLDDMMSYNMATGTKQKSVIVPGNMSINCCSREMLESEWMAFFVAEQLWLLRDVLQKKSIYQIGQNIGIGSASPAGSLVAADQADEWTATTAAVPFQLVRTGAVTPLGQRIAKDIELSLSRRPNVVNSLDEAVATAAASISTTTTSPVFQPSRVAPGAAQSLERPGVGVGQRITKPLQPPRIRGRTIPLGGSGMGES